MPILEPPPRSHASQKPVAPALAGASDDADRRSVVRGAPGPDRQLRRQQLAGLQAQRSVLQRQINITSPERGVAWIARAAGAARRPDCSSCRWTSRASRAQLASRLGIPVERVGPNGRFLAQQNFPDFGSRRGPDPDAVVGMSFAFIFAVPDADVDRDRATHLARPAVGAGATPTTIAPRLDRLEQAVDAIAIEVERVAEGQRFVTKVLTERPAAGTAATSPPSHRSARRGRGTRRGEAVSRARRRPDRADPRGGATGGAAVDYAALDGPVDRSIR